MDDLRRRFAALDTVVVPDVWPDIERRAEGQLDHVVRSQTARTRVADRPARAPMVAFLFVALLIASTVGVLLVGGWMNRIAPALVPSPSTTAPSTTATPTAPSLTFDCAAAQRSASVKADRWVSGPAPEHPRNGWIAAWSSDAVPAVVLVNPNTGTTCRLADFPDYPAAPHVPQADEGSRAWIPLRGPLAWSPDGNALAIVAMREQTETKPEAQALFVWSELGMVGPLLEADGLSTLHVPTWSPDGSMLAVGRSRGTIRGPEDSASVWILAGDGRPPKQVPADCTVCLGGPAYWSPSGDRLAVRVWNNQDIGPSGRIASGPIDAGVLSTLNSSQGGDSIIKWKDESTLWMFDGDGKLTELRLDLPSNRINHGKMAAGIDGGQLAISPDGERMAHFAEGQPGRNGQLVMAGFDSTDPPNVLVRDQPYLGAVWWAPDGTTVGYLIDEQSSEQGIWLIGTDGSGHRRVSSEPLVVPDDVYGSSAGLLKVWQPRP